MCTSPVGMTMVVWQVVCEDVADLCGHRRDAAGRGQIGGVVETVAFVSNTAWRRNATVMDDIMMFAPLDETRLVEVVDCCQLAADLKALPWLAGRVSVSVG